jgi:hypothetical protein
MRYIQADGTPAATPRPASHPSTFRRVTGTGRDHDWREKVEGIARLYGVAEPGMKHAAGFAPGSTRAQIPHLKNINIFNLLPRGPRHFGVVFC